MTDLPVPLPPDLAAALGQAPSGAFPSRVRYYDEVGSTNDVADRAAADGAPAGTAIVAGAQRAGRGRLGRSWFSPPGAGLYVSVIVRPDRPTSPVASSGAASGFSTLTLVAGVALAEALRTISGLPVAIKWPNDLVVARRKLCGILAESAAGGQGIRYVILGFGINLRTAAYPPELADRATSLEGELGRPVDRGVVLASTLASLDAAFEEARAGGLGAILGRWRALSPSSVGARVRWNGPAGAMGGITQGIDDDGALLVDAGGRRERVIAGEVVWE